MNKISSAPPERLAVSSETSFQFAMPVYIHGPRILRCMSVSIVPMVAWLRIVNPLRIANLNSLKLTVIVSSPGTRHPSISCYATLSKRFVLRHVTHGWVEALPLMRCLWWPILPPKLNLAGSFATSRELRDTGNAFSSLWDHFNIGDWLNLVTVVLTLMLIFSQESELAIVKDVYCTLYAYA